MVNDGGVACNLARSAALRSIIMDYKSLTDEQLDEARQAILIEQERRANLAQIPATIQELADKYAEGGGSREELIKAVGDNE